MRRDCTKCLMNFKVVQDKCSKRIGEKEAGPEKPVERDDERQKRRKELI